MTHDIVCVAKCNWSQEHMVTRLVARQLQLQSHSSWWPDEDMTGSIYIQYDCWKHFTRYTMQWQV